MSSWCAARPTRRGGAAAVDQGQLPRVVFMQVSLEALELWDVVEEVSKDRTKDRRALVAIL